MFLKERGWEVGRVDTGRNKSRVLSYGANMGVMRMESTIAPPELSCQGKQVSKLVQDG